MNKKAIYIFIVILVIFAAILFFARAPLINFLKNIFSRPAPVSRSQGIDDFNKNTPSQAVKDLYEAQGLADKYIAEGKLEGCQEVKDAAYRSVCTNNISLKLATAKQDISYCQKLDNRLMLVADCEKEVLYAKSVAQDNVQVCYETSNEELKKTCANNYWRQSAFSQKDISLCDKAGEADRAACRNQYLLTVDFKTKGKDFACDQFSGQELKDDCSVYRENLETLAPPLCFKLKTDLFKNYCLKETGAQP